MPREKVRSKKTGIFACGVCMVLLLAVVIGLVKIGMPFRMPDSLPALPERQYIHFSIDDCNSIFEDITKHEKEYGSLFDQPELGYLKKLHEKYGIVVSCYVYYSWDVEADKFCLSEATDRFRSEFADESDWLKFGFHAKDSDAYLNMTAEETLQYYHRTMEELERITGSQSTLDYFVRLDRYLGDKETTMSLHNTTNGIIGLLTADDPERQSYGLSENEMMQLYREDLYIDEEGVVYTPTDVRIESIENDSDFYEIVNKIADQPRIIVFTHEWVLSKNRVKKYMDWFSQYASERGIPFAFPQQEFASEEESVLTESANNKG